MMYVVLTEDAGVVSATVNVLCELARQNPQAFLPFAPPLFHILTTSNNNWMLIKIIKLVCACSLHFEIKLINVLVRFVDAARTETH